MPKVSVIIPIYNVEKYLRECLDSIINQTLRDIEIICVNDGSPDNSLQILEEYVQKDYRIKVINQKNKGVGNARNKGLETAKGKFVIFMDPDDLYPTNDILEVLYNKAKENNVNICGGEFSDFENGTHDYKQTYDENNSGFLFKEDGIINYKDYQFDFGFTRFIYNREFLIENNLYFPEYKHFEDPVFFVKTMYAAKNFFGIHKITYAYRWGHKQTQWTKDIVNDLLKGVFDNFYFAKLHKLNRLRDYTYFHISALKNIIFKNLSLKAIYMLILLGIINRNILKAFLQDLSFKLKTLSEKIFSVKNEYKNNEKRKVITILGIKLKLKINKKRIWNKKVKRINKQYKMLIKKLKQESKHRKIRVCFLVSETSKWNAQSLYDKMKHSNKFEPFVVVTNLQNLIGRPHYSHLLDYFKSCVYNVRIGWDESTKEGIDLKTFEPDIVFYQQPWELYDNQNVEYVSNFALTCHFSYAMGDAVSCLNAHYIDFYSLLYRYFVFSKEEAREYKQSMKDKGKNLSIIGHPKLDIYKDYKEENYEHKYVIYAPHHSLEENSLNYATFTWNGKYILEWAQKHPEFDWVFKPHPRLKQALIVNNIMNEEEVEKYYKEWENIGIYYNDGSYFDLFKNSKCLITDCCSFLIEYLPTLQPVIHLRNPKGVDYIPACKIAMKSYYYVWNKEDLEKSLNQILIQENDNKKIERIAVIKKLHLDNYSSTRNILSELNSSLEVK